MKPLQGTKLLRDCIYHDYRTKKSVRNSRGYAFCCHKNRFINLISSCSLGCPYYDKESKYL